MKFMIPRILFITIFSAFLIAGCANRNETETELPGLQQHIEWLADDQREGRLAGTSSEAESANYIADYFLRVGASPAGDDGTYFQQFTLEGPMPQAMNVENHISRNVVAFIEGEEHPGRYIILGAHYDGQGSGGIISMDHGGEPSIHNSADDNSSGTAALLELARHYAENRPSVSVVFAAFSGEELGLIGSSHFVDTMEIDVEDILAMINMDMIGRMEEDKLTIFGTGSADIWDSLLDDISDDSLDITRTPSGSGASDHASFYRTGIPVLHYFTGTHDDYHRPTDTADKINYTGIEKVMSHVIETVEELSRYSPDEIEFRESTDPRQTGVMMDGPSLGVTPDYNWGGEGFRISSVREGMPAKEAGLEAGDLIIQIGDKKIADIYEYMETLSDYDVGDTMEVTVLRDDETLTFTIQF